MSRTFLEPRRPNITKRITYTDFSGNEKHLLVTIGYGMDRKAKEIFCADWKAGSDMHAMVTDACILISRLLQYGEDAAELARGMCTPHSLLGQLVATIVSEEVYVVPGMEQQ